MATTKAPPLPTSWEQPTPPPLPAQWETPPVDQSKPAAMSFTGNDQPDDVLARKRAAGTKSLAEGRDAAIETLPQMLALVATQATPVGWAGDAAALAGLGVWGTRLLKGVELAQRAGVAAAAMGAGSGLESAAKVAVGSETAPKTLAEAGSRAKTAALWGGGLEVGIPAAVAGVKTLWGGGKAGAGWLSDRLKGPAVAWAESTPKGKAILASRQLAEQLDARVAALNGDLSKLTKTEQENLKKVRAVIDDANQAYASELERATVLEEKRNLVQDTVDSFGTIDPNLAHAERVKSLEYHFDAAREKRITAFYDAAKEVGGDVDLVPAGKNMAAQFNKLPRGSNLVALLNQPTADMAQAMRAVNKRGIVRADVVPLPPGMPETVAEGQRLRQLIYKPGELANQPLAAAIDGRATLNAWAHDTRFTADERKILLGGVRDFDAAIEKRLADAGPEAVASYRAGKGLFAATQEAKKSVIFGIANKYPERLHELVVPNSTRDVNVLLEVLNETGNSAMVPVVQRQILLNSMPVNPRTGVADIAGAAARIDSFGSSIPALFRNPADLAQVQRVKTLSKEIGALENAATPKANATLDRLNRIIQENSAKEQSIATANEAARARISQEMGGIQATRAALANKQPSAASEAFRGLTMVASHKAGLIAAMTKDPLVEKIMALADSPQKTSQFILAMRKMGDFTSEEGPNIIRRLLIAGGAVKSVEKTLYGRQQLASSH